MRKPRHCRNCGVVKEKLPPPAVQHYQILRYRTGSLRAPTGRFLNAMRCGACGKGVIWIFVDEGHRIKTIAVEPASWASFPSSYYVVGKHQAHQSQCPTFIKEILRAKMFRNEDLHVEIPEGFK